MRERFCVYTMDHLNFLYLECKSDYFRILMLVMGEAEEEERERESVHSLNTNFP